MPGSQYDARTTQYNDITEIDLISILASLAEHLSNSLEQPCSCPGYATKPMIIIDTIRQKHLTSYCEPGFPITSPM